MMQLAGSCYYVFFISDLRYFDLSAKYGGTMFRYKRASWTRIIESPYKKNSTRVGTYTCSLNPSSAVGHSGLLKIQKKNSFLPTFSLLFKWVKLLKPKPPFFPKSNLEGVVAPDLHLSKDDGTYYLVTRLFICPYSIK